MDTSDYLKCNRAAWNEFAKNEYAEAGQHAWRESPHWGIWHIPESDVHLLPDVAGLDVIELGCGTAYVSSWLVRRGARFVAGLDSTPAQLRTAREMQATY